MNSDEAIRPDTAEPSRRSANRPLSVTILGWLFVAVGIVAIAYHATEISREHPLGGEMGAVLLVRFLALLGGVFLLRGANWARWLLVVWLACHVAISAFHSLFEVTVHGILCGVIVYFLFRRGTSGYFRTAR